MISTYGINDGKLKPLGEDLSRIDEATWIDLLRPTEQEERAIETVMGLDVPTREEMHEIELSSRLYVENGAAVMTALVLSHTDADDVVISPVTFILSGARLVTVRYEDPRTFDGFARRAQKAAIGCTSADSILAGLLEAIIERLADILERSAHEIDAVSRNIFQPTASEPPASDAAKPARPRKPRKPRKGPRDFGKILADIGRKGDLTSNVRDSLLTQARLFAFLLNVAAERKPGKDVQARFKTLSRDAQSLSDHASFLSQKITFLLDATLGMVNIEQTNIIKIFSVAAAVFLPPTLIASIYGMNFDFMPELAWPFGYPFAIGLMIASAILPYFYVRHRGWL